jgi:DNA-binding NarL/FixJ family response regulator
MDAPQGNRAERIGLVATDPMRVLGLKSILQDTPFEVVPLSVPGALDDASLALVLIDSECTGHPFQLISTFRQLRPQLKLIVLGADTAHEHIQRVIGAGAKGYLALTASEPELRMAIETVRDGSVWAPRKVLSRLLDREQGPAGGNEQRPRFTARELEVLTLLREGHPNREIAHTLGIDEATVKAHLGRLMRKVGVSNRIALTMHPFTQVPSVG